MSADQTPETATEEAAADVVVTDGASQQAGDTTASVDDATEASDEGSILTDDAPAAEAKEGDEPAKAEDKPEGEATEVAPYEGLAAPEGFEALDTEAVEAITPVLRGMGVETTEQAQEFLNKAGPIIQNLTEKAIADFTGKAEAAQIAMRKTWAEETQKQAGFEENKVHAARFRDKFASEEMRGLLKATGLGNHPEMFNLFAQAGRAISEDGILLGGGASGPKSTAEKLYGPEFQGGS